MTQNIRNGAKIKAAKRMRRALSKPELWLWLRLRERSAHGLVFRNQHPFGPYILDFFCSKAKLCIEVDGEIYTRSERQPSDKLRDQWLSEQGLQILRIIARDVLRDPDETANYIVDLAKARIDKTPPTAFGGPPSP